jgi:hypothetical protein
MQHCLLSNQMVHIVTARPYKVLNWILRNIMQCCELDSSVLRQGKVTGSSGSYEHLTKLLEEVDILSQVRLCLMELGI